MKKIVLIMAMAIFSVQAFAAKENVNEERIPEVISEVYPGLVEYYEAGVLDVESLTEQTLGDGSVEYDIKYKFIKNYYDESEINDVLKEQYPDIYIMSKTGFLKDISIFRFVDKNTGKILNYVAYNRNNRPIMWRM